MGYTVSLQRNPNLSIPQINRTRKNNVLENFGSSWWTGLSPELCPGFNKEKQYLQALPLLNTEICSRQDILDYFNNCWTLTELLFASIKDESTYIRPPYHELRHPMMFYYGHTAVVYYNKMRLAGIFKEPLDLYLEKVLETGVDEMSWDDMSKNEMEWPALRAVHEYRKKVYSLIVDVINNHPGIVELQTAKDKSKLNLDSPLWSILMGFEHEKIHFETSSVLIRELPLELLETPRYWAPIHPSASEKTPVKPTAGIDYPFAEWVKLSGGQVSYGKPVTAVSYGWDNEYGTRTKTIKDFLVTNYLITNGEFYEFVSSQSYINDKYWSQEGLQWRKFRNTKRPTFWVSYGPEGLHDYKLRTLFDVIDMPWSWPVEVNYHEAHAYIQWKNEKDNSPLTYRLITEPEHHQMRDSSFQHEKDPVLQKAHYRPLGAQTTQVAFDCTLNMNMNLQFSSASPVSSYSANENGVRDLFGNVWQWAEDQFNPLDGFKAHPLYDDFSTPCFDGKHQMILGGSFMSCGHEASKWARFHFRPHFFQHAGFRIAATLDGSSDNGSTKLKKSEEYIHPQRQNILDQMSQGSWWKNIKQPLEFNDQELKELWERTVQSILTFEKNRNASSPMGSALDPATNDVSKGFIVPYQSVMNFPERSEDYQKILQSLISEIASTGQQPGHPGYMAYMAGAGNSISNMAQALAQTLNQYTSHFSMSPGLVTLETEALRWIINMLGFPINKSAGIFTTGATFATTTALSIARKTKMMGTDLSKVRFYTSAQAHHSIGKALSFLGFPEECLTYIKVNKDFKMDTQELVKTINEDKARGLQALCLIGTAGSTNTGAVDNISELANVAQEHNLWLHIDAAYGGFFMLTKKGQLTLNGLERADSIALDPHKSLSLPYGTGCLIVRDGQSMKFKDSGSRSYMPPTPESHEGPTQEMEFADISNELSRDYRGLRFWLPIKTLGIGPFQLNLEEKLELAHYLFNELKSIPGIEVITEPQLTVVNFKMKNTSKTRELLTKINQTHQFFLSGCTIEDNFVIRVCLLGFRLHFDKVQSLIQVIRQSLKELGE